jgi:hypothetical protein
MRIGSDPTAPPVVITGAPRHAHLEGFDLHANVAVRAGWRAGPTRAPLAYVLWPPVACRLRSQYGLPRSILSLDGRPSLS